MHRRLQSSPGPIRRFGRLVLLPVALVLTTATVRALARQAAPRTQTASDPPPPAIPMPPDGGRLTTFSDRGLIPFGDRRFESFGRRGLESFSDIPLAPMGGVEVPGPSARRSVRRPRPSSRSPRIVGPAPSVGTLSAGTAHSVASIHGVTLPPVVAAPVVVLPPVALPELPIDPRPALATIERSLDGELARARRRGDADLVRTLATRD